MKPQQNGRNKPKPKPKSKPPASAETRVEDFLPELKVQRGHYVSLLIVCLVIIGFWIWSAEPNGLNYLDSSPDKAYYNLLVQGLQSGQLNLKTEVPAALAQSADPYSLGEGLMVRWYDGHRLLDLSYYHGKLYLYFGVTPVVVLLWPYAVVTGHYLPQKDAVLIFCVVGFLAGTWMLYGLWRRCFAEVSFGVLLAGVAALGLATGLPMLLSKCDVYEVAISCGFAFVMLSLAAVWGALTSPQRQGWWLAAGSLAYGLAVGARPDLLFGAGMLLIPIVLAWRKGQKIWTLLLAAGGPMFLVGSGLMLYNDLRFGSPLEFGLRYQLGAHHELMQHFSPRYLWCNFCVYFLEPVRWSLLFPFVHESLPTHLPAVGGYYEARFAFGILTGVPLVWLGLAVTLGWRGKPEILRGLVAAVAWLGGIATLTLCLYYYIADRYEVEFLPALVLLGVIGIFSLERALAGHRWHRMARCGWVLLLVFSVGFNLLHAIQRRAMAHNAYAASLENRSRTDEAISQYQVAVHYDPYFEEPHYNLACIFDERGQIDEAINQYQEAVRLEPNYVEARNNLANDLVKKGRIDEAISQYQEAIRLQPGHADMHCNFGLALTKQGKIEEANSQFQEAIRLKPNYAEPHNDLGADLLEQGRTEEAISEYQEAIRLKPDLAQAHNNLGVAYANQGKNDQAAEQFQEAVRLKPDFVMAHYNFAVALDSSSQIDEAIRQYQEVIRLQPDYADAHYNLGADLYNKGRIDEAISQFKDGLRLKPDDVDIQKALARALKTKDAPATGR